MNRQEAIARIEAIAARPGYQGHAGYQGDARALVGALPDVAFSDPDPNSSLDIFEDSDGFEPRSIPSGQIWLLWKRYDPSTFSTASLQLLGTGYGAFDVHLYPMAGITPAIIWQPSMMPGRLSLYESVTAPRTLESLFAAYLAG